MDLSKELTDKKDVFVHASAVREAGLRFLNEGDELTFEVEDGDKGPSAVKLQKSSILIQTYLYRDIKNQKFFLFLYKTYLHLRK